MASHLLIQTGHLRECVQGLVIAQAIKRQRPDARVIWVGRDRIAGLARVCPHVDKVHAFPRDGGVLGFFQLLRHIRKERAHIGLDLQGILRTALLLRFSGALRKVGRRDYREAAGLLYPEMPALPAGGSRSHALDTQVCFLPHIGLSPAIQWPLDFGPSREFNSCLDSYRSLQRPIVIFPGARRRSRRWNGFRELTNFILLKAPRQAVVWLGEETIEGRDSWRGGRFLNLTGRTTLDALPQMLRSAALVIANDTGAAVLAASVGRPTLTIHGPTEPERSGPHASSPAQHRSVHAPLSEISRLDPREVWEALRNHPDWPG